MSSGLLSKKKNLTEIDHQKIKTSPELAQNLGDRWGFVAVLPDTGFIQAIHNGKRTQEQALIFLQKIKSRSNGLAPLFLSDAWFYGEVLEATYCNYVPVPYKGRGRPPLPKRVVDENLKYAQVYKKRNDKGKIEEITTRIIKGNKEDIFAIIQDSGRATTINTSFVESRNGKYRKDNARLIRDTLCHSKKDIYHDAHSQFLTTVFNYCRENKALRVLINPDAPRFHTKFLKKSAAMGEGIIDKILTLKELLCRRVPKVSIL